MSNQQTKPESKSYSELIHDIEKGIIKIPKFQREFVWSIDKTAQLLDSILKGYPIGTFILWQTDERMNNIKTIGNLTLPDTPEGDKVQYVLDGQQRITSLYAALKGAKIQKTGEKKDTDYSQIFVDLEKDIESDQVIISEKPEKDFVTLNDVLNMHVWEKTKELQQKYSDEKMDKISKYSNTFRDYIFSTVLLRRNDIESAIEVFTRINTGGQTLTLFEIMASKTYDEAKGFDMSEKWDEFIKKLEKSRYDGISSSIILNLLSLILSEPGECKRKTILKLDKDRIIRSWDDAISSLERSIDHFRKAYGIPVSQLLPYDTLLVPFAYFFFSHGDDPDAEQRKYLQEFFWRASLSYRYASATESRLAQDIKRINLILKGKRPGYDDMTVKLNGPEDLIETEFRTGNSYCKAVLCLMAQQKPKDFQDNAEVFLDNSNLIRANSRNYHHFFPKTFLKKRSFENENSLMNITLISDHLNKHKIKDKAPSSYISEFEKENKKIVGTLQSHLIELRGFGIEDDDYEVFLKERAKLIYRKIIECLGD